METKFCRDCREHRPVEEFTKNKRSRDGLAFYCREHLAQRSAQSREARRVRPRTHRFAPQDTEIPEGHKWCPDCSQVKPLEEFPRTVALRIGRATYCLPCHNVRGKASREKLGGSRTYHLSRRYGMSAEEADAMLDAQGGVCAICRVAPAVHVDHDHETGAVRALLCVNCNGGLGQFKDDPHLLHAAAFYVELHIARQQVAAELAATGPGSEGPSRPGEPPVGSQRRPGPTRSTRGGGRGSDRRRAAAREADE